MIETYSFGYISGGDCCPSPCHLNTCLRLGFDRRLRLQFRHTRARHSHTRKQIRMAIAAIVDMRGRIHGQSQRAANGRQLRIRINMRHWCIGQCQRVAEGSRGRRELLLNATDQLGGGGAERVELGRSGQVCGATTPTQRS